MTRSSLFALMLLPVVSALGQPGGSTSYVPAVPSASSFSAYGGGYGWNTAGATAEGSAMQGMASVISARGDYNLATSAAAVNLTQAQKQDIQNRQDATAAYFAMQETNRSARESKRSPRLSQEQLVRIAAQAAPQQISSREVDPVNGRVAWPELLTDPRFAAERSAVESVMAKQATYGSLTLTDHETAGQAIEGMSIKLKGLIQSVSAQKYVAAKNFLKSLMYSMTQTQLT
jgi:hypothetical protein